MIANSLSLNTLQLFGIKLGLTSQLKINDKMSQSSKNAR